MHDQICTYCILYDVGDPDFDPKDKAVLRYGDHLLMATWEQIERDKPAGLITPVLVREFVAPCWEKAMQFWNDLRGFGPYKVTCQSPIHEGDPSVKWCSDDGLCASCLIEDKLVSAAEPFRGVVHKQATEQIKIVLTQTLRSLTESGFLTSHTVSSSKTQGGGVVTVWAVTAMGEKVQKHLTLRYA